MVQQGRLLLDGYLPVGEHPLNLPLPNLLLSPLPQTLLLHPTLRMTPLL